MRKALGLQRNFFRIEGFRVMNNKYRMDRTPLTEATIRLYVGGNEVHTASMGDGPVNALDRALRKALTRFYPSLEEMKLIDYKVRVLSGERGTEAKVRVLVESTDGRQPMVHRRRLHKYYRGELAGAGRQREFQTDEI